MNSNIKLHERIFPIITYVLCFSVILIYDFRYVSYDASPDYIANGIAILQYGKPLNAHHPGTLTYYLTAFVLWVTTYLDFNLTSTVYSIKSFLLVLGTIIIFYCKQIKSLQILLIFCIGATIPGFYITLNVISAELLLLPLSMLLLSEVLRPNYVKVTRLGVITGVILNVKFSGILILPYAILALLYKSQFYKIAVIKFLFATILTFSLVSLPILEWIKFPISRSINQAVEYLKYVISTFDNSLIIVSVVIAFCVLGCLYLMNKKVKNNYLKAAYSFETVFLLFNLLAFAILLFITITAKDTARHFVPFIPFLAFTLSIYILNWTSWKKSFGFFFILYWPFACYTSFTSFDISSKYDKILNEQIKDIYFMQTANFNSEIQFIEWLDYRYGKSSITLPERWRADHKIYSNASVELLNTRNKEGKGAIKLVKPSAGMSYKSAYSKIFKEQIENLLADQALLVLSKQEKNLFETTIAEMNFNSEEKLKLNLALSQQDVHFYNLILE